MKRKNIIAILLCGFIALTVNGCSGFLNQQPQTLTSSTAFNTSEGALKELIAAYAKVTTPGNLGFWVCGDVLSNDALKGGSSPSDQGQIYDLAHFQSHPDNGNLESWWKNMYQGIHRANLVIHNVPDVQDINNTTADRYVAEAKFLRAFFYFRLVKIFGGVPLITKANIESYQVSRSSKDDTYKQIEQDLKDAIPALPPRSKLSSDEYGRATKGAAEALLTRVYLMRRNFKGAEKYAKKIIDSGEYSLNPDYASIFMQSSNTGPEAIFTLNFVYNPKYGGGNTNDIYRNSRAIGGYGFDLPTKDLHNAFNPQDPRLKATIYANGDVLYDGTIGNVGSSATGYIDYKAYRPVATFHTTSEGRYIKFYRLGEIYLWYAEAANENGQPQVALKYLNKIRDRARGGRTNILPDITTTDQAALRKKIYHAERVEYALEGKHFWDLIRTGRAAKVLHAYAKKYNTSKGAKFHKPSKGGLFPIPETQIELSKGTLKQNPDYN
jgi:hypothetical protein